MSLISILIFFVFLNLSVSIFETYSNEIDFLICKSGYYEISYLNNFKLSFTENKKLLDLNCKLKEEIKKCNLNILILNSDCFKCSFVDFDYIFKSIPQSFQNLSRILLNYEKCNLNIFLQEGAHWFKESDLEYNESQFFRSMNLNISLKVFANKFATINLKTNQFFIFISNFLIIENIFFYGNDLTLDKDKMIELNCYSNVFCCFESNYSNNDDCLNYNKKTELVKRNNYYGLFNLEKLYEDEKIPVLIIRNCSFINFFFKSVNLGFNKIISFSFKTSKLFMENTNFTNSYFFEGLIFYHPNFDLVSIYFKNNFSNTDLSIYLDNCNFFNYNKYDIINDLSENKGIIVLINWTGVLKIINCQFFNTKNSKNFINIYGNFNSNILINNFTVTEFYYLNSDLFYVLNCNEIILNNLKFKNVLINKNLLFNFINNNQIKIENSYFISIKVQESNFISSLNSNILLNSCFFNDINSYHIINAEISDIKLMNLTFYSIKIMGNILFIIKSNYLLINYSSFWKIEGNSAFALFNIKNTKKIEFENSQIKTSKIYSIYFITGIEINSNEKIFISNNTFSTFWNNDPLCYLITFMNSFIISNKILIQIFKKYDSSFLLFRINNSSILKNLIYREKTISTLSGYISIEKLLFVSNIFLNQENYGFALDFEMNTILEVEKSLFLDNGIITKKNIYNSFYVNGLFNLWSIISAKIFNSNFLLSKNFEMTSGFLVGVPFGFDFQLANNSFILLSTNKLFYYKGIIIDNFLRAELTNNTFINLKCNNLSFSHQHGSILFSSQSNYNKAKNNISIIINKNKFFNCSCGIGGSMSLIGINNVKIIDTVFYNSSAWNSGGTFAFFAINSLFINNISVKISSSKKSGAIQLLNINNFILNNSFLQNCYSSDKGNFLIKNIINVLIVNLYAKNAFNKLNGGLFLIINSVVKMINVFLKDMESKLNGAIFFTDMFSSLNCENFKSINSYSHNGGVLFSETSISISFSNSFFKNSFSLIKGSSFFFKQLTFLHLKNIIFFNQTVENGFGGLIFETEDENSLFKIENTIFNNSKASGGSCIFFTSSGSLILSNISIYNSINNLIYIYWPSKIFFFSMNLTISDCVSYSKKLMIFIGINSEFNNTILTNNTIGNNVFDYEDCNVKMAQNYLSKNSFLNFIEIKYSQLRIDVINLDNNYNFISAENSLININNCFIKFMNQSTTSIFVLKNSNTTISNSIFLSNKNQIIQSLNGKIYINNSFFNNNYFNLKNDFYEANDIYLNSLTYYIFQNTHFNVDNGLSIHIFKSNGQIINSNFISISNFSKNSAIQILETNLIFLKNSIFYKFYDNSLYFIYSTKNEGKLINTLNISDSKLIKNNSTLGSAIYIIGNYIILIENTLFYNNYAKKILSSHNDFDGSAPCLFFQTFTNNSQFASITLIKNEFIKNIAEYLFPTIFSQANGITLTDNIFKNNYDYYNFTNIVSCFPFKINFSNENITIISGIQFNISFFLMDCLDQLLIFDNNTIFNIKYKIEKNISFYIENTISQSKLGSINFLSILIKTKPDTLIKLRIEGIFNGLLSDILNRINKPNLFLELNLYARSCILGEILKNDNSCFECTRGTYSLIDPMDKNNKYQLCILCPENAECPGGKTIIPHIGFFKFNNMSRYMTSCIVSESCQGGLLLLDKTVINKCLDGNYGTLCYYCENSYGKNDNNSSCFKCSSFGLFFYFRIGLFIIYLTLYILFVGISAEKEANNKKSTLSNIDVFLKILVNHSQYLTILIKGFQSDLADIFWQNILTDFMDWSSYFSFFYDYIFSNECILQLFNFDPESNLALKIILNSIFPIFLAVFSILIWLLGGYILKYSKRFKRFFHFQTIMIISFNSFANKILLFILISIFMFYPNILNSIILFWSCIDFENENKRKFLKESPDIECWGNSHNKYLNYYAIPGLIFWGLLPLFIYYILKKHILILSFSNSKKYKTITEKLKNIKLSENERNSLHDFINITKQNVKNSLAFSFFYKEYKSKYFYWECLNFFKKLILTFINNSTLIIDNEIKGIVIFSLIIFNFNHIYNKKPFKVSAANQLEMISWIACLTTSIAANFLTENNFVSFNFFIAILCGIFNFVFYGFFIILVGNILIYYIKEKKSKNYKTNIKDKTKKLCVETRMIK